MPGGRQADRLRLREGRRVSLAELLLGDQVLVAHHSEHGRPAGARGLRVDRRVVGGRIGRDPGEERRLGQRQLGRLLVEVHARGHLDPVRGVPEVDRVQVGGEDPVLRPATLELPRERGLLELSADRPVVCHVRVLHELLRDRRRALDVVLRLDVRPDGAGDAADVDALVLPEAAVLDRDDRALHVLGDLVRADDDAALRPAQAGEDGLAVGCVDEAVLSEVGLIQRIQLRDVARDRRDEPVHERDRAHEPQNAEQRQEPELAHPPRPLLPVFPAEAHEAGDSIRRGGTSGAPRRLPGSPRRSR